MQVHHGYDEDHVMADPVDHPVWKSIDLATSHSTGYRGPGPGIFKNSLQRSLYFVEELIAKIILGDIVLGDGFRHVALGRLKKLNSHRDLEASSLPKTSAAGTDFISPRSYAESRSSDSAAQS